MLLRNEGTVLGLKGSLSYSRARDDTLDGAVLTHYSTEHFGTRGDGLSGHVAADGAIGGGSARTEGGIGVALDFGYRLSLTQSGGPFLRAGVAGRLLGHSRLRFASLQPLQLKLGYQVLQAGRLFEWGLTAGATLRGRFDVGDERARALDEGGARMLEPSPDFGSYFALWWGPLRASAALSRVLARHGAAAAPLSWIRATLCAYVHSVALCAEANQIYGDTLASDGERLRARAFYGGLSIGLTP